MIDRGISFGNIHSYYDLDLILSSASIPPAEAKTNYIDIPGGDGSLDLTEVHGEPKYNDREGCKFTFTMNPSGSLSDEAFEAKKTEVSNALNGIKFERIIIDKDPDYYYSGRCRVDDYLSNKRIRQIVVSARLSPYKYRTEITELSFGISSTESEVIIKNSRKTVVPEIICTDDETKVVFGGIETMLSAGSHKILDIQFKDGDNILKLSGSGTVTIKFREADL